MDSAFIHKVPPAQLLESRVLLSVLWNIRWVRLQAKHDLIVAPFAIVFCEALTDFFLRTDWVPEQCKCS